MHHSRRYRGPWDLAMLKCGNVPLPSSAKAHALSCTVGGPCE